jgi:hypothetical protein
MHVYAYSVRMNPYTYTQIHKYTCKQMNLYYRLARALLILRSVSTSPKTSSISWNMYMYVCMCVYICPCQQNETPFLEYDCVHVCKICTCVCLIAWSLLQEREQLLPVQIWLREKRKEPHEDIYRKQDCFTCMLRGKHSSYSIEAYLELPLTALKPWLNFRLQHSPYCEVPPGHWWISSCAAAQCTRGEGPPRSGHTFPVIHIPYASESENTSRAGTLRLYWRADVYNKRPTSVRMHMHLMQHI